MAEIHDQFDTVLILDFGSQVGAAEPGDSLESLKIHLYSIAISSRADAVS